MKTYSFYVHSENPKAEPGKQFGYASVVFGEDEFRLAAADGPFSMLALVAARMNQALGLMTELDSRLRVRRIDGPYQETLECTASTEPVKGTPTGR